MAYNRRTRKPSGLPPIEMAGPETHEPIRNMEPNNDDARSLYYALEKYLLSTLRGSPNQSLTLCKWDEVKVTREGIIVEARNWSQIDQGLMDVVSGFPDGNATLTTDYSDHGEQIVNIYVDWIYEEEIPYEESPPPPQAYYAQAPRHHMPPQGGIVTQYMNNPKWIVISMVVVGALGLITTDSTQWGTVYALFS